MTHKDLAALIEKARKVEMTPHDREQQRRSFAYGNANIENAAVTREIVESVANQLVDSKFDRDK